MGEGHSDNLNEISIALRTKGHPKSNMSRRNVNGLWLHDLSFSECDIFDTNEERFSYQATRTDVLLSFVGAILRLISDECSSSSKSDPVKFGVQYVVVRVSCQIRRPRRCICICRRKTSKIPVLPD